MSVSIAHMSLYHWILIIAFIFAVSVKDKTDRPIPYIKWFLGFCVVIEVFFTPVWTSHYKSNLIVYYFFSGVCVLYYLYVYYTYFKSSIWLKYVNILIVAWVTYFIYIALSDLGHLTINSSPYSLGMMIVLGLALKYFYNILYVDIYRSIKYEPLVYFSSGIILFYASSFSILTFVNLLIVEIDKEDIYRELLKLGNIFLTLGYLIAVICSKKISD